MPYPNLSINLINNQISPDNSKDNIALLVVVNTGTDTTVAHLANAVLYSEAQASISLGINAANDTTAIILRSYHITEFFRKNPKGTLHFLNINGTASSSSDIGDIAIATRNYIRAQGGDIKQVAVAFNSSAANFIDILHGGTSSGGAVGFQSIADTLRTVDFMPVDVFFLEGCNMNNPNPADFRSKNCPNVAIVLGNDLDFMDAGNQDFVGTCAVGTILGCSTNKRIDQSLAHVGSTNNNLTSSRENKFLKAAIFGLNRIQSELPSTINQLHERGYIFPRVFPNFAGVYWHQSSNCVPENNSIHNTERVQVVNKAYRVLYATLLPYINQNVETDAQGRLTTTQRKLIENVVANAIFANMRDNINELKLVLIDPEKNENGATYPNFQVDKTLRVVVGIVPFGKVEQINVSLSAIL